MTLHPTVEDVMLDPAHFQSAGLIDDQVQDRFGLQPSARAILPHCRIRIEPSQRSAVPTSSISARRPGRRYGDGSFATSSAATGTAPSSGA
jgi:hypothetical protein